MTDDPEIEYSQYNQAVSDDGLTIHINIFRIKDSGEGWCLEIEDELGNSTTWDDLFETDLAAVTEAKQAILEDSVKAFVGPFDGQS